MSTCRKTATISPSRAAFATSEIFDYQDAKVLQRLSCEPGRNAARTQTGQGPDSWTRPATSRSGQPSFAHDGDGTIARLRSSASGQQRGAPLWFQKEPLADCLEGRATDDAVRFRRSAAKRPPHRGHSPLGRDIGMVSIRTEESALPFPLSLFWPDNVFTNAHQKERTVCRDRVNVWQRKKTRRTDSRNAEEVCARNRSNRNPTPSKNSTAPRRIRQKISRDSDCAVKISVHAACERGAVDSPRAATKKSNEFAPVKTLLPPFPRIRPSLNGRVSGARRGPGR
jgi:hypothetical protein